MTGHLNVCRCIQIQKLRKQHEEKHWLNAFIKYHKYWAVDVYNVGGESAIIFVG